MTFTPRRTTGVLLALLAATALLLGGQPGWLLALLIGAWLLMRPSGTSTAPRHAASARVPPSPVRAVSPAPDPAYWFVAGAAGVGTAAALQRRDDPAGDDEEDVCDEAYGFSAGAAAASAEGVDADEDFGGYGGGDDGDW